MTTQQALSPFTEENLLARLQTRYIQVLAVCSILMSILGLLALVVVGAQQDRLNIIGVAVTAGFLALNVALLALLRFRRRQAATLLLLATYTFVALYTSMPTFLLLAILVGISVATLGTLPIFIVVNTAILGKLGFTLVQGMQASGGVLTPEVSILQLALVSVLIVTVTTRYFVQTAQRAAESAESGVNLLRSTAIVGQLTATLLTLDELLPRAVELIRDHFAFYHVQVFLVNEAGDQAVLVASTGEVGQQLLERQHRLTVGSRSVIGRVTQSGEPALARDTDQDVVHRRNELLPNTRSELALPLMDGVKIIGALDVQSTRPDAFQPADVQALQVLANQLATAVRNARLFEQQARIAQENKRFFLESEANLREIQRLNQQLTKTGWADFLRSQSARAGVTLEADRVIPDAQWSETLAAASQNREVVTQGNGDSPVIAVPVMLRGEVIGAIEVEPGGEMNPNDAVEMVQAVAQRLAVSLDNARLFEEAQLATAQEQRINAIVSQYQSVTSVDDLLRITLTELSQTLGAQRGAIRLGAAPKESVNGGHA